MPMVNASLPTWVVLEIKCVGAHSRLSVVRWLGCGGPIKRIVSIAMTINILTAIRGKMTSPYNSKPSSGALGALLAFLDITCAIPEIRAISAINNALNRIMVGRRHDLLTIVVNSKV